MRRFFFGSTLVLLVVLTFGTVALAQAFQLPIVAAGAKPNTTVAVKGGSVEAVPFRLALGKVNSSTRAVSQDLTLAVTVLEPGLTTTLAVVDIVIEDVDLTPFGNENASANGFLWGARNAVLASVGNATADIISGDVLAAEVWADSNGNIVAVDVDVGAEVALLAGPGTAPFEKAVLGYNVSSGDPLVSERVRVTVDGLDYTNLDPSVATFKALIEDIEAGVLAAFNP